MRIIHFSDFHLRADHLERAESIIKRLKETLRTISEERKIDLIIFSGDMIDKAGKDFSDPKIHCAFEKFKEMVILPLTSEVGLAPNRFVYTMGNHEIDRSAVGGDDKDQEITDRLKNHEDVDWYIHNDGKDQPRIAEYNRLRDTYWQEYKEDATIKLTPFQYGIKFNIDGKVVGVNCLNTAWRCYKSETDEHKIVLGKSQITDSRDFFEDCHIRLAVGHHHPNMMNPFETNTLKDLIARNYDAFFCGHTHDNDGEYVGRASGSCFYFTSPGTLSTNESAERQYRNGFMVIDYELDERFVETQCYYQDDNADFIKERNYGTNGVWHMQIPGSTIVKPMALSLFCQKKDGDFLRNDKIDDVIAKLRDKDNATIQLVALSGLGKTRILREAFDDGTNSPNCYYCEFSDSQMGLLYDVTEIMTSHKGQEGLIVLDNCSNSLLEDVITKRDEYASKFRIIGVNNEFYDRRNLSSMNVLQLFMTQDEMKEMVNDFIEKRVPERNGSNTDREQIKKIADGFPGMAVLLVEEYLKEQHIDVHTVDHVVKKLLKFEEGHESEQEIVMRSLSLFQPFPYRNEYKEAYRFIRNDEGITPLYGKSPEEKRHLFSHTINLYDNSLIEITQSWLNVRPFPLAVWLVGKWFEDDPDEERMVGIVERIQALDKPLYTVVRDGLYKRLDYMQDSESAQDLIQRLAGEAHAPFCNEKVVCSDLGSRLFLAMSSVNPGAIASCLYRVLLPKGVAWAKDNIIKEIRRNLIWSLEKLCFSKESYQDGSKVLALLAAAENETWGNNATGQFKQLFHIMLPGTEATLQERLETLHYLKISGKEYEELALECFDRAFDNGSFVRDGSGAQFGLQRKTDYMPKSNIEIVEYWEQCRDMLMSWLEEDKDILERTAKLSTSHAFRWAYDGMLGRMLPLLNMIADMKGGRWEEMYTALNKVNESRLSVYQQDVQEQINVFKQRIRPTSFCQKLKDARMALYDRYDLSPEEEVAKEKNLFEPLAKEFLDERVYLSENEIKDIATDKEYLDIWFSLTLNELMSDSQLEGLLSTIILLVEKLGGDEFRSNFVSRICYVFRNRKPLRVFLQKVYDNGYHGLYVRLMANAETEEFLSYGQIKADIKEGRLGEDAADDYLSFISLFSLDQVGEIIKRFYEDYPERIKPLMGFVLNHRYHRELLEDSNVCKIVKQLILSYPITEETNNLDYEYARYVTDILEKGNDNDFAADLNRKLIEDFNKGYLHGNFDGIYSVLVKKYRNVIWDDFESAFVSDDYYGFLFQIKDEIGSGTSFGVGALFQVKDDKVQNMCKKYPGKAPLRVAQMIPVFKDGHTFSDWFMWMLDEFGDQKDVLDSLHANMGTFTWGGSIIPLLRKKMECLNGIKNHKRVEVREWVEMCLQEIEEDMRRELNREEYMRLHYN